MLKSLIRKHRKFGSHSSNHSYKKQTENILSSNISVFNLKQAIY